MRKVISVLTAALFAVGVFAQEMKSNDSTPAHDGASGHVEHTEKTDKKMKTKKKHHHKKDKQAEGETKTQEAPKQ